MPFWIVTRNIAAAAIVVAVAWPVPALAKVITVAKDGSGDVSVIQSAISLSAPGDTIRIRPGIYTDHEPYIHSFGVWDAYVAVKVDSLTIIGAGPDSVIIGPATPNFDGFEPKGIGMAEEGHVTIEGVTIRNVRDGMNLFGGINLSNVEVEGCYIGVVALAVSGLVVEQCVFKGGTTGLLTASGSRDVSVALCTFESMERGLTFLGSAGVLVRECEITSTLCAISVEQVSSARLQDIRVVDAATCSIDINTGSDAAIENSVLSGGDFPVSVIGASLSLSNTIIGRGDIYTFLLSNTDSFSVTGCDISIDLTNPRAVNLSEGSYTTEPPKLLDMRNNYWGATDSMVIADAIWDIHDDPVGTLGEVLFVPFGDTSVPVQPRTMGRLKAGY